MAARTYSGSALKISKSKDTKAFSGCYFNLIELS